MSSATRLAIFTSLFSTGCFTPLSPTPDQLAAADYGPIPPQAQLTEIVHHYLEVSAYYNPNGALVEECTTPEKAWVRNYRADRTTEISFGWKVTCNVNPVSPYGGYQGFARHDYVIRDVDVIEHHLAR